MQKVLIQNEVTLLVQPSLAVKLGLKEAMILQQIHYWLNPKRNTHFHKNRHWVHNTYGEWKNQFPFWSLKTIQRSIERLEGQGLLDSYATHEYKKTKFYSINYARLENLEGQSEKDCKTNGLYTFGQNVQSHETNCPASGQTVQMTSPPNILQPHVSIEDFQSSQIVQKEGTNCLQSGQSDPFNLVKMTRSYIPNTEITTETTLLPPLTPPSSADLCLRQEEEEDCKIMLKVWDEVVYQVLSPGKRLHLTDQRKGLMHQLLKGLFDGKMEEWKAYCKTIAECPFLMGNNAKNFHVTLDWALSPCNALKVLENDFYSEPVTEPPSTQEQPWEEYEPLLKAELKDWPYGEEWLQISQVLVKQLGQVTFNVWFRQLKPKEITNTSVTLLAANAFMKDYILREYTPTLKACVTAVYPLNTSITIDVDANIITDTPLTSTKGETCD